MKCIIPLFALVACATSFGQDYFSSGDTVELSPFMVESASSGRFDPRYRAAPETTCAVRRRTGDGGPWTEDPSSLRATQGRQRTEDGGSRATALQAEGG